MNSKYAAIIALPHHVSKVHPQMSMADRAAQFAPFAALNGYDDAVRETARLTDDRIDLSESTLSELNGKIQILREQIGHSPNVTFTYFKPDDRKGGGTYLTAVGKIRRIDDYSRLIVLEDGTSLPLDDILEIESDSFPTLE